MGKRIQVVVVCALVLGALTGGVSLATASSIAGGETIQVELTGGPEAALLDFDGDGRFDMGDRVVFSPTVVDPATGDRLGRALNECIAMNRVVRPELQQGWWACSFVLRLSGGNIMLQGPDPAGYSESLFAVTGGTGLYRNARGEADFVDAPDPEITIRLEP